MKTVEEIFGEMLEVFRRETGMEAARGCDLWARLYALAAQVYALQVQTEWTARQSFPQTAQGEWLDRHAALRGLERKEGVAAEGRVRFLAGDLSTEDRVVPKGAVCMTAGLVRFVTTQEATLQGGNGYVEIPVRAVEAGERGNVAAGAIRLLAAAPVGVAGCTNPQPCTGGGDREGDEDLRKRVLDTFRRLPNGANAAYYQSEALAFDRVAGAAVVPRPRGVGSVDVVVTTHSGIPDQALLTELEEYFQSRREIAVDVALRAPDTRAVNVTVQVAPGAGYTQSQVNETVKAALEGWFTGERLGQSVLRAQLGDLIYRCEGVANYAITAPSADVAVEADELPQLGTLTVGGMA